VTLPGREGKRIPWSLDFTWKRRKAYLLVTWLYLEDKESVSLGWEVGLTWLYLEEKESVSLGHVTLPGREGKHIPWVGSRTCSQPCEASQPPEDQTSGTRPWSHLEI
jgi:hypothetical protein